MGEGAGGGGAEIRFQSRWHYPGTGDRLDLYLSAGPGQSDGAGLWHDHHTMVALDIPTIEAELAAIGFEVTLLQREFSTLQPWDQVGGNVLVVAVKPAA